MRFETTTTKRELLGWVGSQTRNAMEERGSADDGGGGQTDLQKRNSSKVKVKNDFTLGVEGAMPALPLAKEISSTEIPASFTGKPSPCHHVSHVLLSCNGSSTFGGGTLLGSAGRDRSTAKGAGWR